MKSVLYILLMLASIGSKPSYATTKVEIINKSSVRSKNLGDSCGWMTACCALCENEGSGELSSCWSNCQNEYPNCPPCN